MRILGEINDLPFKVTALEMNQRISIKLEDGQHEITFKFRDGSAIANMKDVQDFVQHPSTLERIQKSFDQLKATRSTIIKDMMKNKGFDFPEII
jgi:hypothetical protein